MANDPPKSEQIRAAFEAIAADWRLEDQLLQNYRDLLEQRLASLDHRVDQCGGWDAAMRDAHAKAEMLSLELLLTMAAGAHFNRIGADVHRGRSAGGRARARPSWHDAAVKRAKILLAQGRREREVAGILAPSFGRSTDAVRRVLQRAGVIPKARIPALGQSGRAAEKAA